MFNFDEKYLEGSVSGVAEATGIQQTGDKIQVNLYDITGTGTVTVTVCPGDSDEYRSLADGTITLGAPTALIIEGRFNAVKATSDNSGDTFTMEVRA